MIKKKKNVLMDGRLSPSNTPLPSGMIHYVFKFPQMYDIR